MKKILLAFLILIFSFGLTNAEVGTGNNDFCSQSFPVVKLRYGQGYVFDDLVNNGSSTIKINGVKLNFNSMHNFGNFYDSNNVEIPKGGNLLSHYDSGILKLNKILPPKYSGKLAYTHEYEVLGHPATVNTTPSKSKYFESDVSKYDIFLIWTMRYKQVVNGVEIGNELSHTECQPYSISWCGDGILDPEYDETCDPKDPKKQGWGTGGCDDKTCKPIVKNPSCDLLRANPTTGTGTVTSNFTCEGTNATNFKIDIKNGASIINTINGKTGSFTFTNPGTYVATCFADDRTSAACEQVITVKPEPKPESKCVNLEVSKVSVEKGQTANFTCTAENTNNYKIKIVNDKGTVVKEIFGRTGDFTFPEKGTYVASCYVDDKKTTENTCVKPITVTEPIIPRIDVDKTDKNPLDKDGIQENDTQTIDVKDPAVFKITVTNNGTEELKEIFLKDDVIESDVDAPKCDKTIEEVNQILQAKFGRTTFKPGESFEYTCDRANNPRDPETYTNKIVVEGKGVISLKGVKDEDPTKVNKSKDPKIKVDKTDKNPADTDGAQENDTQTITKNGTAVFKITVTNNGTEDLRDVFLRDDVLRSDIDAPQCDKSIDEVNNILKTIGNRDTIFNIGETFTYTCERKNVTSDLFPYTNKIDVTGTGITSGKVVKDEDPTVVKVKEEPNINVDKTDKNPKDLDKIQENDTQTIDVADPAIFKITVRNNGTEDLEKIYLKDDVLNNDVDAPKCDKSIEEVNQILQAKFGRTVLKPGESFDYTCDRPNADKDPQSYINKITVFGVSVSGTPVKDDDDTSVNKKTPKIKVDKTDKNPADTDGAQGNDTQTIKRNGIAVFQITVTNNGTEDLKDVSLVDDVLNNNVDAPQCDKSIAQVNEILKTIGNRDTIFNVGETFTYTCERANVTTDTFPYTNEIKVSGTGVISGKKVEDKDPTVVKVEEEPKIKVDKTDKNPKDLDKVQENDTQTIDFSDPAIFKITVRNNGTEDLEKISLVDDVLNNDTDAPKCNKSIEEVNKILQDKFGRTVLKPGESFDYTCERPNTDKDPSEYVNKITVFGVSVSGTPVKDNDETKVKTTTPKIKVDKTDKNPEDTDGKQENDTQTLRDRNSKAVFKITVRNNGTEDLKDVSLVDDVLNNNVDAPQCDKSIAQVNEILKTIGNRDTIFNVGESFDYTCERPANSGDVYPYTNEIKVTGTGVTSGKKVEDKDPTVVKVKEDNKGDSGRQCTTMTTSSGNNIIKVTNFPYTETFDCKGRGSDKYELYVNGTRVLQNNTGIFTYKFDNRGIYNVECKLEGVGGGTCKATIEPSNHGSGEKPKDNTYCGDGRLQRGEFYIKDGERTNEIAKEECDLGSKNGPNSWCSSTCQLADPITVPGEMGFFFGPQGLNVIGKGMNPYSTYKQKPYIENTNKEQGEIFVKDICVSVKGKVTGNNIGIDVIDLGNGHSIVCEPKNQMLKMGQRVEMSDAFVNKIKSNGYTELGQLITTIRTESGKTFENTAYLSSGKKFQVRVAKGSASTVGGGVSYLDKKANSNISDSNKVTIGTTGEGKNSNFVGASLTDFLTSYSKQISSGNAVTKAENEAKNNNNIKVSTEINNSGTDFSNTVSIKSNEFKNYNGISGVKIITGKNVKIYKDDIKSSSSDTPTTYIIENGNLLVDGNVQFGANIAFIVKGGNIKFSKDVTYAQGTYIAISYGKGALGKITSDETPNQLVVSGALYGNISDLTTNRTYLKVNNNGQLDTGTVVSYGSSSFRNPAPLVGTFIQEYMNSTKVAQ